jgi:hypothetical protein
MTSSISNNNSTKSSTQIVELSHNLLNLVGHIGNRLLNGYILIYLYECIGESERALS